ncbi:hypothetical protein ACFFX1_11835 [Dactylosporangium sucinum]|uniref:Regulatory protein n=1 Tax=Dactylosporangium sucinum TaxID=1424081 RepID=A0A917WTP5_9ACTN|nr:hypothetical protein [Dactylosporangium sucinum]GGM27738.1 putative regulatory protein [Dactylosporangium sucinum]
MRLLVNTDAVQFTVTKNPEPKLDQKRQQRFERSSNLPMWSVQMMALDENGAEVLNVTVVSEDRPQVSVGQTVLPVALVALPWSNLDDGKLRSGVAFRADSLKSLVPSA